MSETEDFKPDWMKQKEQLSLVDRERMESYEAKREKRKEQRLKKELVKKGYLMF